MRNLVIAAAVLAFAVAGAAVAKDYKNIKIATEGAYAPWNFKDKAGNLVGFEVDLAKDLCARMKIKCTIVEQAWDGMIPSLTAGKYDAIMAGMSIKAKREKVISFSRNYAATLARFVVLKSSPLASFKTGLPALTLDEVEDAEKKAIAEIVAAVKGKSIGVQTTTTHEDFLRKYMGNDVDIRTYDTQENLDLDLKAGRVDAALADMSYWIPLLKKDEGKSMTMTMVGPEMTKGPFGVGVGVGIRKEDGKLRDMFSKAINEAIDDGTLRALAAKWFSFDISAKK